MYSSVSSRNGLLVSRRRVVGDGAVQDQPDRPLRVRGREQDRHRPTLGDAVDDGAVGPGRVHHRSDVVHPGLEAREPVRRHAVGETDPALVEQDQARERREPQSGTLRGSAPPRAPRRLRSSPSPRRGRSGRRRRPGRRCGHRPPSSRSASRELARAHHPARRLRCASGRPRSGFVCFVIGFALSRFRGRPPASPSPSTHTF